MLLPLLRIFTWLLLLQFLLLHPLAPRAIRHADLSALPPLAVGDWVLRRGMVLDSRIIMQASNGQYSHIGMITRTEPEIEVVHATTDDGYAEQDQVFLSPLTEFLSPDLAEQYQIIRPHFLSERQKQQLAEDLRQRQGEAFLLAPRNRPHLYCTTLLSQAIQRYIPHFAPEWQYLDMPLFNGEYLFPKAFEHYPQTDIIYRSDFAP